MSTLALVMCMLSGMFLFATLISFHATVVTARSKAVPRWLWGLGAATLLVASVTVITIV
jgi:hypothetical protein